MLLLKKEADECCYWLELIIEAEIIDKKQVDLLLKEANELTAIFTSAGKTAKQNKLIKQNN